MQPEDVEKASPSLQSLSQFELENTSSSEIKDPMLDTKPLSRWERVKASFKGVESRGIEPVPLDERQPVTPSTSLHMLLMWFSMTLATNNIIVGSMGTLVLGLSFKDAAICAVFGNMVGAMTVGYMSTWGPRSGNRTLVIRDLGKETSICYDRVLMNIDRSWPATSWVITPAGSAAS